MDLRSATACALPLLFVAGCLADDDEGEEGPVAWQPPLAPPLPWDVAFSGCQEFFLFAPIPAGPADALVPDRFTVLGAASGRATLGVGVATCDEVRYNQTSAFPLALSDVGILVESPEGDATLNVYQLWQVASDAREAQRLDWLGIPSNLSANITLDQGTLLPLGAAVATAERNGTYGSNGMAILPSVPMQDFVIQWWHASKEKTVVIRYSLSGTTAEATGTVAAAAGSDLAALVGAPSVQATGFLPAFDGTAHVREA